MIFDSHTGRHDEDVEHKRVASIVQQFPQHALIQPLISRMLKRVRITKGSPREVEDHAARAAEAFFTQRIRVAHNAQQVLALLH